MTRRINILVILTLLCGALAVSPASAAAPAENPVTESIQKSGQAVVGEKAPFLSGWTVANKVFSTAKIFKDESIQECVLVFWASWCPPCLNGLKMLATAEDRFEAAGIRIVLVNYSESPEKVQEFLAKHPQPYSVVLDRWQKSAESYLEDEEGSVTLPRTVLIDRTGLIKAIYSSEGDDYVERILAGE